LEKNTKKEAIRSRGRVVVFKPVNGRNWAKKGRWEEKKFSPQY